MRLNPVDDSLSERIKAWMPDFSTRSFNFIITVFHIQILQISIFILTLLISADEDSASICTLMVLGAKVLNIQYTPLIVNRYQVWRLVTPILLHSNKVHILGNLFFQLRFGFAAEKYYERKNYIAIYVLSGIGGNILSSVLRPESIAVGASTSIYGLLAVVGIYSWYNWHKLGPGRDCNMIVYGLFVVYGFLMSFLSPVIDLYGHLGGYFVGGLAGVYLIKRDESSGFWNRITIACLVGLVSYFSVLLFLLFSGDYECPNKICSICDGLTYVGH